MVTLITKIIWVSSIQLYNTSAVYYIVENNFLKLNSVNDLLCSTFAYNYN